MNQAKTRRTEHALEELPHDVIKLILECLEFPFERQYHKYTKITPATHVITQEHFTLSAKLFFGYFKHDKTREIFLVRNSVSITGPHCLLTHRGLHNDYMIDKVLTQCLPMGILHMRMTNLKSYSIVPAIERLTKLQSLREHREPKYQDVSNVDNIPHWNHLKILEFSQSYETNQNGSPDRLVQNLPEDTTTYKELAKLPNLRCLTTQSLSIQGIHKHTNLRALHVQVGIDAKQLVGLTNLKSLSAKTVKNLSILSTLTALHINDRGQEHIEGMIRSQIVELYIHKLDPKLLQWITKSSTIQKLTIYNSAVQGPPANVTIVHSFTNCTLLASLVELHFGPRWHLARIDFIDAVLESKTIRKIRLDNEGTFKFADKATKKLANHESLIDFSCGSRLSIQAARNLLESRKLQRVSIPVENGRGLITKLDSITDLTLSKCELDEESMAVLFGDNKLESLSLENVRLLGMNFSGLQTKTNLTKLSLVGCITEDQAKELAWVVNDCDKIQDLCIDALQIGVRYRNE
jgi:hypothetical protein